MSLREIKNRIIVPAPTLEALLGSRDAAHALIVSLGYRKIVDVHPFFAETATETLEKSERSRAPRILPACPRARVLCADAGKPELVPDEPSPAERAIRAAAANGDPVSFVSPCPFKAKELTERLKGTDIDLEIVPLSGLLADAALSRDSEANLERALSAHAGNVATVKTRGIAAARELIERIATGAVPGPLCVDMQACDGGCLGGAWCPPPVKG